MRSVALPIALFLGLGIAHGATPGDSSAQETQSNPAEVTINRDDSVPQGCTAILSLDDDKVATLANGDSTKLSLPAGSPYLRAILQEDPDCALLGLGSGQSLLLEPGEQRSFTLMYGNDALFFAPQDN